ncbi:MAG TPA: hypothetical protein VF519_01820 [Mycobacteriales bacterium]
MTEPAPTGDAAVERAFGADNRGRLLARYFDEVAVEPVTAASAWRHVYRLLLWIDRTTGLAHCYESDKSQPGRPWYARSLRFHAWVADELGTTPADLATAIDWLFRAASADLARVAAQRRGVWTTKAIEQRALLAEPGTPLPGEDSVLADMLCEVLSPWLTERPPDNTLRDLVTRVQAHIATENKRKNLVGEGFEDTLAEVLRRIPDLKSQYAISVRTLLHDLPGFNRQRDTEKPKRVDLGLIRNADSMRVLVSCKWSIRSDREEQFTSDFEAYSRLEALGQDFQYVLVTNEFDPARLAAACEARRQNGPLFSTVVHVNPAGPREIYRLELPGARRPDTAGAARASGHIDSGRLTTLASWLRQLAPDS